MQLTRREFFQRSALVIGGAVLAASFGPEPTISAASTSEVLKNEDVPIVIGWGPKGELVAGIFTLDLASSSGRTEAFLETASPQMLESSDYDRFPIVQLVRASGKDSEKFFWQLGKMLGSKQQALKPNEWQEALTAISPAVAAKWSEMGKIPEVILPERTGKKFIWDTKSLNTPLPNNDPLPGGRVPTLLDLPPDSQTLYWMAKAKNTTLWPIDQGRNGGLNWFSNRVSPHQYENWRVVAAGPYRNGEESFVGPEGSLPYMGINPIFYKPVGSWQ